jgi:hypothetical protein
MHNDVFFMLLDSSHQFFIARTQPPSEKNDFMCTREKKLNYILCNMEMKGSMGDFSYLFAGVVDHKIQLVNFNSN